MKTQRGTSVRRTSLSTLEKEHKKFQLDQEFYELLLKSLEDHAVFTTDKNGVISTWNTGAQNILGYTEQEIIGKSVDILFTPEDKKQKRHIKELQTALKKGKARDERWHVRKGGKRFWAFGLVYTLKDKKGSVKGFTKIMRDLTHQKQLIEERDKAIIEAGTTRQKLYNFFMQAPALIAVLRGREGIIELFNPLFSTFFGNRDVLGKPMRKAFPELKNQGWFELVTTVFNTGKPLYITERAAKVDRSNKGKLEEVFFNFVISPSFDIEKRVEGVIVFGFEVTDQVMSRRRLQISEERLQLAQKTGKIGSFEWNIKTGESIITPELEILYGHKPDRKKRNLGAKSRYSLWLKAVHPEDRKRVNKEVQHSAKTGKEFNSEYRIIWPDKSIHYLATRAQVIKDKKGKPMRMVGVNIDITERKLIENNLQFLAEASKILSSSLDYEQTLNTVAKLAVPEIADWCGIDILDGKGGVQQVAIAHKDPKKVKWAKELRKTQPPDLNAPTGVPHVIRTGQSEMYPLITDEMLVKAAKNQKHLKLLRQIGFTSVMIVPLCRESKCIGAITFVTTETRRAYNEADLAMAEELAARASLAIDNAWLYKGSKNAIALRDDFISVASHELKTPITSVKIFTQLLQKHSEQIGDTMAVSHLNKMGKQIDKLTELIYNLLDISKIQAGRMQFEEKQFDFDTMIEETVDMLQQSSKQKIIIQGSTNKRIFGDEDRLSQVVSNLISNAVKYSPQADKVIVSLSSSPSNVTVSVQDFGVGISKEHLNKIFERFYRVFDATDKTFPGLGIGLYISSEIVKRHHGKFWVESDKGKGSKFSFSLPIKRIKLANGVAML